MLCGPATMFHVQGGKSSIPEYKDGGSYTMSHASGEGAICWTMGLARTFLHLTHRLSTV